VFLSARNNRHVNAIDVDFETKEIYGWMLDSDQIADNRHVNAIDVDFETKEIYGWMLDSDQIADNRHLEISQNAAPRLTQDLPWMSSLSDLNRILHFFWVKLKQEK